ncbi:MAG TPA: hypothetical protein VMI31_16815 [Fimbriimonadaceae bacterium]|nr:hypothetical protein [Fimbriimonadaceae bacterium]
MRDRDFRALEGHHHAFENVGWDDVQRRLGEAKHEAPAQPEMCGSDPSFAEAMDLELADAA